MIIEKYFLYPIHNVSIAILWCLFFWLQNYYKKMTYANLYAIFDAEVHEETIKKQSIFFVE